MACWKFLVGDPAPFALNLCQPGSLLIFNLVPWVALSLWGLFLALEHPARIPGSPSQALLPL